MEQLNVKAVKKIDVLIVFCIIGCILVIVKIFISMGVVELAINEMRLHSNEETYNLSNVHVLQDAYNTLMIQAILLIIVIIVLIYLLCYDDKFVQKMINANNLKMKEYISIEFSNRMKNNEKKLMK